MDGVLAINRMPPWSKSKLEAMAVTSPLNEEGLRSLVIDLLGERPEQLLAGDRRHAMAALVRRISKSS